MKNCLVKLMVCFALSLGTSANADVTTTLDGDFTISGDVFSGDNTFLAIATSNLGNVTFAQLNVVGVSQIPEPGAGVLLISLAFAFSARRTRQGH